MTIEVRLKIHTPSTLRSMAFRLVETRLQEEPVKTSYAMLSKVDFLSSHSRSQNKSCLDRILPILCIRVLANIFFCVSSI
jgi:hypothetical protein